MTSVLNMTNMMTNDDKYTLAVALSYKQIKIHPERTSKTKPFIGQYN